MTDDQILELWKSRLFLLEIRNPEWIETTFFMPLIMMILPLSSTGFRQQVILSCSISGAIALAYSISVYLLLRTIKNHRFRGEYAYPKTILLYSMYDIFNIMFVGMLFWTSGVLAMESNKVILTLLLCLLLVIILGVLTSRGFLTLKIRVSNQENKYGKYMPIVLALGSALPGLGILAATMSPHNSSSDLVLQMVETGLGSFLMYFATLGICEIVIIGLRKWPQIKRIDSHFNADWGSSSTIEA